MATSGVGMKRTSVRRHRHQTYGFGRGVGACPNEALRHASRNDSALIYFGTNKATIVDPTSTSSEGAFFDQFNGSLTSARYINSPMVPRADDRSDPGVSGVQSVRYRMLGSGWQRLMKSGAISLLVTAPIGFFTVALRNEWRHILQGGIVQACNVVNALARSVSRYLQDERSYLAYHSGLGPRRS
jgi:hypothetical protein